MQAFREEPMMPPEESVRSWAMVRYSHVFFDFLSYPLLASRVYFGFQPFMKVDDSIKKKAAEIVAGANTPEEKIDKIFNFCRENIKNTDDKSAGPSRSSTHRSRPQSAASPSSVRIATASSGPCATRQPAAASAASFACALSRALPTSAPA